MNTYTIITEEVSRSTYTVEAENEKEAKERVLSGEVDSNKHYGVDFEIVSITKD